LKDSFFKEYGMLNTFASIETTSFKTKIAEIMKAYSTLDPSENLKLEIDLVKSIMVSNIEKVLERGDAIDILVDRTSDLSEASTQFRRRTTVMRKRMCFENQKATMVTLGVFIILVYLLIGWGCGYPLFGSCLM
jgi:vesicle-associated membrane protein 7